MTQMTVAEVLVRYLREQGVSHVFGVSGHSIFDITDAIYQEPGIDFVPSQIEVAAGYTANGYARATGGLSVCLVSSGGGATNAVSGVAQAYKESYPVITISSEVDQELAGKGASSWHEIPQREMFAPLTKMSVSIERAEDTLEVLEDAVRAATSGRPGPVYIGVPRNIQVATIDVPAQPWSQPRPKPAEADARQIAQAAELLAQAQAPTIIAGGGVHFAGCIDELIELAELLGAPIGVSPAYKGLVSEDHPLGLGQLGSASAPFANKVCQESDVILAVGTTFSEPMTLGYGHRVIPEGARIVQIDVDPVEIGKVYPVEVGIAAHAKPAVGQLLAQVKAAQKTKAASSPRLQRLQEEKAAWRAEMAKRSQMADGPINAWQIYDALREATDPDAVIIAEGGTMELMHRFVARSQVYHGGEFRPIGHGIATALGLKCAYPDRQVVCVAGDGSFMMELNELATAKRANLPITIVVVHNGAYGNMKRDQIRSYGGRVIGTELFVPELTTLAQAFGCYGARVERPSELLGAIKAALAASQTAILDVVCPIEGL
jgi:acetolactate synthase I/II/III large subunit